MHTCVSCGVEFDGRKRKYCTNRCQRRTQTRIQNVKRKAAGYTYRPTVAVCGWCGQAFSGRRDQKFCSNKCGQISSVWLRHGHAPSDSRSLATLPRVEDQVPLIKGAGRFTAGNCRECGSAFVSTNADITCSARCRDRHQARRSNAKHHRRRVRLRGHEAESFTSKYIFERDGYRCHLCRRLTMPLTHPLHPRHPTMDHLIPVARGGAHTRVNVATACRMCNSSKSDAGTGDQLALLG